MVIFSAGRRIGDRWATFFVFAVLIAVASPVTTIRADDSTGDEPPPAGPAPPPAVPFVAAFERFAVHEEIAPESAGRLLLTELSCTACHATDDATLAAKGGPRLDRAGSRLRPGWIERYLADPASTKPGTTMPDVLGGLEPAEQQATIAGLVAYLGSRTGEFPRIKASGVNPVPFRFWDGGDPDRGRELYHSVGCVACHSVDPDQPVTPQPESPLDEILDQLGPEELRELGLSSAARRVTSVPLPNVAEKYTAESLTHFLFRPEAARPSGRMPNLKLLTVEAADLAAYLRDRGANEREGGNDEPATNEAIANEKIGNEKIGNEATTNDRPRGKEVDPVASRERFPDDPNLVAQGRRDFVRYGCANCHDSGEALTGDGTLADEGSADGELAVGAPALAGLDPGRSAKCSSEPAPGRPDYALTPVMAETIIAAIGRPDEPTSRAESNRPEDNGPQHAMLRLNCYACHERDGLGGVGRYRRPHFETVGNIDLGDEGRLPPPLTDVGRKLKPAWLKRVLKGDGDIRPHMTIRMPRYPAATVEPLPAALAAADRGREKPPAEAEVFAAAKESKVSQDRLVEAGRELMDAGCVQCHSFRGYALPGVVGVELDGIADRVQPDWFHDFVLQPGRLKPRTRMPTFFPDGKSQNMDVLDGDTELQLAAIWTYLKGLDRHPLPKKIDEARSQDYELRPEDRPIVLRTFMESAGTHAIAVGFPAGVHIAFDAEQTRIAAAWRGRFLDSQGTWFSRFTPPADPLGEEFVTLDAGPPLATLVSDDAPWPEFEANGPVDRFRGYRLDPEGVPTFRSTLGSISVDDRATPGPENGLSRVLTFRLTDQTTRSGEQETPPDQSTPPDQEASPETRPATVWLRALVDDAIDVVETGVAESSSGVRVEVRSDEAGRGRVRTSAGATEWLFPIRVRDGAKVEVTYRW